VGIPLRHLAIRLALPFSWRLFPKRRGQTLQRFAITEADSAWHFLYALSHVDQPRIRARLFNNALEEVHHASLFQQAAKDEAQAPIHLPTKERSNIYSPSKGLQHFYAFVYVGEKDVYDQFDAYASAIDTPSVREIFVHLKEDEDGHMQFAEQRLAAMPLNQRTVLRQVRIIRWQRLLETWGRGLERISDLLATVVLSAIYFFLGVLGRTSNHRAQAAIRSMVPSDRVPE
jgi:rubrerythrin